MNPSVIVWDLETVRDLDRVAAANDFVGKSDAEVRGAIASGHSAIEDVHFDPLLVALNRDFLVFVNIEDKTKSTD